jgi:hypothetical protein
MARPLQGITAADERVNEAAQKVALVFARDIKTGQRTRGRVEHTSRERHEIELNRVVGDTTELSSNALAKDRKQDFIAPASARRSGEEAVKDPTTGHVFPPVQLDDCPSTERSFGPKFLGPQSRVAQGFDAVAHRGQSEVPGHRDAISVAHQGQ